jgi:hypothetical protein
VPNIIATLAVDQSADPPTATIELRADGQVLTPTTVIPPEAIIQLGDAVGQATGDPRATPALRQLLQPVVDALQRSVDAGATQQAAREAALAQWTPVIPPTA